MLVGVAVAVCLPAGYALCDLEFRRRFFAPVALGAPVALLGALGAAGASARLLHVFALDAVALAMGWSCYMFVTLRGARSGIAPAAAPAWAVATGVSAAAWLVAALLGRLVRARLVGTLVVERRAGYDNIELL